MMNGFGSAFGGIVFLFLMIAGIAAIFVPFWVYRIRNEMIETNKMLGELVKLTRSNKSF